jgi:23S rRNA (cytosine1962-C5)-methyltransferase
MKLYTAAWIPHVERLLEALGEVATAKRVVLRLSRAVQAQSPRGIADGTVIAGPPIAEPIMFEENGLRFEVDPIRGQKTGFFLDQRDNRAQTEALCRGASVLDAFAYTGAFTVYAARGGAREVTSVDVSRDALQAAAANLARNCRSPAVAQVRHRTIAGDAFEVLEALGKQRAEFDVVILDPPAFAKTRNERAGALSAYRRLAMLGLGVLRRGGTLVAASCSTQMTAPDFFRTVREAAGRSRRRLKELARTGHALDHPIRFREGEYLKCLFSVVQ